MISRGYVLSWIFVVCCFISLGPVAEAANSCPGSWTTFGSSCYYFFNKTTWDDARKQCENRNMSLLTIESDSEYQHIKRALNSSSVSKFYSWVGVRWNASGVSYMDVLGRNLSCMYSAWPNGTNTTKNGDKVSACGMLRHQGFDFAWALQLCSLKQYFICKDTVRPVSDPCVTTTVSTTISTTTTTLAAEGELEASLCTLVCIIGAAAGGGVTLLVLIIVTVILVKRSGKAKVAPEERAAEEEMKENPDPEKRSAHEAED